MFPAGATKTSLQSLNTSAAANLKTSCKERSIAMNKSLVCHVVAGYPSPKECLQLLFGMQAIGVEAIEVQIPFSDPIADGETIMEANDAALNGGITTAKSFELIKTARQRGLETDLYIMSYLQKA